jgi:hypothetical protein
VPEPFPEEFRRDVIAVARQRATPKRRFAVNSKIRRPDYLPNVA